MFLTQISPYMGHVTVWYNICVAVIRQSREYM